MNKILVLVVVFFTAFFSLAQSQTAIELTETFIGLGIIPDRNVGAARDIASQVIIPDRMVNISVLTKVRAGEPVTVGFVNGQGNSSLVGRFFLVRAIGEGLKSFGVKNTLKDPVVKIYSGESLIFTNDDWIERLSLDEMRRYESFCGAFPVRKDDRFDSVSMIYLVGGHYTVTVQGVEPSDEGTVLVEIYEITFPTGGKG
ncbi:MAG TPA: hypothetical protein PLB51_01990 [Candidatus Paceibacterota bacterium]|nr:hypothetical protein [Candidatus Paceibacterota bacterium]